MNKTLYEKLEALNQTNEYAFHMPGHKRNSAISVFSEEMKIDITEIEGFDNLHHPEGILKKEQEFASHLYGTKKTYFLINGSTCGVLAALCAMTMDGEEIIMSRNAHRSAYNAAYLKGLKVQYIYPQFLLNGSNISGEIEPQDVAKKMDKSRAKVVFITSPTYEGIVSDIAAIAKEVHERDGILIVDEAHGAHLGFHEGFPKSAISQGADIVIQSMHKTLPSLTQTALLHICSERIPISKISFWLSIFQTSSPSYVLMNSISRCLHFLQNEGKNSFELYYKRLQDFYDKSAQFENFSVLIADKEKFDCSKINICTFDLYDRDGKPYGGKELAKDLSEKYQLQVEMVTEKYVLAMTSICDTQQGFDRLLEALFEIDKNLVKKETKNPEKTWISSSPVMTIKAALEAEKEGIDRGKSEGKISAEYIYLYPPGSPILAPGEIISKEILEEMERYLSLGLNIQGPEDYTLKRLRIVKN